VEEVAGEVAGEVAEVEVLAAKLHIIHHQDQL
jgi:hypothetical protein